MKPRNYARLSVLFLIIFVMINGLAYFSKGKALSTPQDDFNELMTRIEELVDKNKDKEAIPLLERSIKLTEKAVGPKHPAYAKNILTLGVVYQNLGNYGKAEDLFEQSLEILEKALGPEHLDVATSLNNLANLYLNNWRLRQGGAPLQPLA